MIFFKKQHEDIAGGFLKRMDYLLRSQSKAVAGYSIDGKGVETLRLKIGKTFVSMTIEGEISSHHDVQLENDPLIPAAAPEPAPLY
jgi:hypothetical protein